MDQFTAAKEVFERRNRESTLTDVPVIPRDEWKN